MPRVARVLTLALLLTAGPALTATTSTKTTDWPHLRGPQMDGRTGAPGTFSQGPVGLEVAFRVPLGSGYSGVAVADGKAVTLFADGEADWVGAFDATTGKEAWRHRLGERTHGRDGAHDGPLSSPIIGGGAVYALGSDGRLLALDLSTGKVAWEKKLEDAFGAKRPHFGFTTTPVYGGGHLVLLAGGPEGKAIVGLDARTGETLWSLGDDRVDYQSPAIMTLAGREQVVVVAGKRIAGLTLDTGSLLWAHPLEEGDNVGSSTPSFMGEDRFMLYASGGARAYRVSKTAEGFGVEELYRSNALGGNYAPPVAHEGHLYGFRGNILTCASAETGERVWRSREPGGDGLILVDGHLVIFGAKGNVVVAKASPAGYEEVARLEALDGSSLTWPSFAEGRIYLRNLQELAAVTVRRGAAAPATAVAMADGAPPASSEFGRWLAKAAAADSPQAQVDARFGEGVRTPLVEGDLVHFIYRDAGANDVGLGGSMIDHGLAEPLLRLAGTDLFYRTYSLSPVKRWEYHFHVNFEDWKTDPRNPRTVPALEGDDPLSELVPAGYQQAAYLSEPKGARGKMDEFTLSSKILGYEKKVQVWLPPGYDKGKDRYPLLLVNDSAAWIDKGLLPRVLDNLVGAKKVAPVVVAFVDADRRWWLEAGGSRTDEYVDMLANELAAELDKRYRLAKDPASRAIMGGRFYGFSSAYAALKHPERFGAVAAQSPYMSLGSADSLLKLIAERDPASVRFYVDWNLVEERNIDRDWDFARDSRSLDEALQERGFHVTGGEQTDSFGWGGLRERLDEVLTTLFPAGSGKSVARSGGASR